jgi:hypothetical protein
LHHECDHVARLGLFEGAIGVSNFRGLPYIAANIKLVSSTATHQNNTMKDA